MASNCNIKLMTAAEMDIALDWAAREGWNPGLHDGACFLPADANGFFMAWQNGRPVGCISAVKYGQQAGFIGMFLVIPACRGHRIGLELANAANIHLGPLSTGIDGVEAKVKNYQSQYGFEPAWRNFRMTGSVPVMLQRGDTVIRPTATLDFKDIVQYDQRHFPGNRQTFLKLWLTRPHTVSLAAIDLNGVVKGLGSVRPCRHGTKIGPLFADNPRIAEDLLRELLRDLPPGSEFYLDVPEPNSSAMALASRYDMKTVFSTIRMYRCGRPELPLNNIFGITCFELG